MSGFMNKSADPFTPAGSKAAKFISSINKEDTTKAKTSSTKINKDINISNKYALPEEKKKIFYDVKMDGVNFSRIITNK